MATVQIRNLDDRSYAVLKKRAAASGRSLQEFLRIVLEEHAAASPIVEVLSRGRADLVWTDDAVTMDDVVEVQRAGRAR